MKTKAKIQGILINSSQKSVIGWAVEEDDFEAVAEEIVKNCFIPNVMPSCFSFKNYTKQKGDCDTCVLVNNCRPHTSTVTVEGKEYNCPLKFEENWA